jgi:hypothetical protein
MIWKLSELYDHDDDIVVAIERWVKNEAEVGRMARSDSWRLAKAASTLKKRFDDARFGKKRKRKTTDV